MSAQEERGAPGDAPATKLKQSDLPRRVVSAVVLAPLLLAAVYFGTPYVELLVLLASAILAWEWAQLCGGGRIDVPGAIGIAAVVAAILAAGVGHYRVGAWLIAVGAAATALSAAQRGSASSLWYAVGVLYAGLPSLAFLWLRFDTAQGLQVTLLLILVVWATDIGAYAAGRTIGGPKLTAISPNKTWSGLAGGVVCAGLTGAAVAFWLAGWPPLATAAVSLLLALLAQAGDVFESGVKRHFGVKDASHLIPGHGGLMDRLDGLLAVTLVVGLVLWLQQELT